ncbi:MAG: hypothetical protein KDH09_09580 [Chrysiogenetes bacterium]|nr:hypothetical protein [Chrysiogenetes bacterium]
MEPRVSAMIRVMDHLSKTPIPALRRLQIVLAVVVLALALPATSGCGLGECILEPKIEYFYPSRGSVEQGEIVYLGWESYNETSCEIVAVTATEKVYFVPIWKDTYGVDTPVEDVTYWLVCENSCGGRDYAMTQVSIISLAMPE